MVLNWSTSAVCRNRPDSRERKNDKQDSDAPLVNRKLVKVGWRIGGYFRDLVGARSKEMNGNEGKCGLTPCPRAC